MVSPNQSGRASTRSGRAAALVVIAIVAVILGWFALRGDGPRPESPTGPDQNEVVPSEDSADDVALDAVEGREGERSSAAEEATTETTPAPTEAAAPSPDTAMVVGIVIDPTGAPAPGAFVAIGGATALNFIRDGGDVPERGVVETDAEGRFELEVGRFPARITAKREGLAASETLLVESFDDGAEPVRLRLRRPCTIRGHVWRSDGTTIAERRVRFLMSRDEEGTRGGRQMFWRFTDESGAYVAEGLDPGRWELLTVPSDEELERGDFGQLDGMLQGSATLEEGDQAEVELGAPRAEAVRVSGRVLFGGEPVKHGILHWIREGDDPTADQAFDNIDKDGTYEVELTGPGQWFVRSTGGSGHTEYFVDIPAQPEFTHDIVLPEARIEGVVVDPEGRPVPEAAVTVLLGDGTRPRGPLRIADDRTETDESGAFSLDGLDPGTYTVGARNETLAGTTANVVVTKDEVTSGVTVVLGGGRFIQGTVKTPDGLDAVGAPLWFIDSSGAVVNPITSSLTNGTGFFQSRTLPVGSYHVFTQTDNGAGIAGPIRVVPRSEPSESESVEIRMERGGTILGRVMRGGKPVTGHVVVRDAGGRQLSGLRDYRNPFTWRRHPVSATDRYFGPLPAGDYIVHGCVDGRAGPARTVTVVAGETVTVELDAP